MLAAASNASLDVISSRLADLATRLGQDAGANATSLRAAAMPDTAAWLRSQGGRVPRIDAIAVVGTDGELVGSIGAWPGEPAVEREAVAVADSAQIRALGGPIRDPQTGGVGVPVMQRIEGPAGKPLGAVIAMVPLAEFTLAVRRRSAPPRRVNHDARPRTAR